MLDRSNLPLSLYIFLLSALTVYVLMLFSHFSETSLHAPHIVPGWLMAFLSLVPFFLGFHSRRDWEPKVLNSPVAPLLDKHLFASIIFTASLWILGLAGFAGWVASLLNNLNGLLFLLTVSGLSLIALIAGSYAFWLEFLLLRATEPREKQAGLLQGLSWLMEKPMVGDLLVIIEAPRVTAVGKSIKSP